MRQNEFHNNEIFHAGLQQFSHGISNALFSEFIPIFAGRDSYFNHRKQRQCSRINQCFIDMDYSQQLTKTLAVIQTCISMQ